MKTLTLIRHAKSDWSILGQNDFERGLSSRGEKQWKILKKFFEKNPLTAQKIYCSTAVRAKLTYFGLANKKIQKIPMEFCQEIYDFHTKDSENFADFIRFFDDNLSHIAIIGHNPMFDNFLITYTNAILHMPTASIVEIIFDIDHWAELKKWKIVNIFIPKK